MEIELQSRGSLVELSNFVKVSGLKPFKNEVDLVVPLGSVMKRFESNMGTVVNVASPGSPINILMRAIGNRELATKLGNIDGGLQNMVEG